MGRQWERKGEEGKGHHTIGRSDIVIFALERLQHQNSAVRYSWLYQYKNHFFKNLADGCVLTFMHDTHPMKSQFFKLIFLKF